MKSVTGGPNRFGPGVITIEQPWSRAIPSGAKVASGYLTIKNAGDSPDRLVSVTAEIAGRTGIHQMSMSDGTMQMREVTEGLPVPANGSVALKPGSYHLMFMDLKRPLEEGEAFSGNLTFEKAGRVDVTFEVEGLGATAPSPHAERSYRPHGAYRREERWKRLNSARSLERLNNWNRAFKASLPL